MFNFPTKITYTDQELYANFWKCKFTSIANPALHYTIILPNNVKPINLAIKKIDDFELITLGIYRRIEGGPLVEVFVAYEHIKNEINPSDWLQGILQQTGEEVINHRIMRLKTGDYIDCLTRYEEAGKTLIARYTVFKDFDMNNGGANYILVKALAQDQFYNKLSIDILRIVSGFQLINQSDWQMAEQLKQEELMILEQKVNFYYPISWKVKQARDNNQSASRIVLSQKTGEEHYSVINFWLLTLKPEATVEMLWRGMVERMKGIVDYQLAPLDKVDDYLNPSISELWEATGELIEKESDAVAKLSTTIGRLDNIWFYLEMVGPKEEQDYYHWAVNKRARALLLHSLNNPDLAIRN